MKNFFSRLRDRQHLRKLNKEKHELIGYRSRCGDTQVQVGWLNAALARATKNGDSAEVERLTPICLAAREEFRALLAREATENKPCNETARTRLSVGVR